jgi:hypothetical protein
MMVFHRSAGVSTIAHAWASCVNLFNIQG